MATKSSKTSKPVTTAAPAAASRRGSPAPANRPVSAGRGSAAAPAPAKQAAPAPEPEVMGSETVVEEMAEIEYVDEQNDIAEEATAASGDELLDLSTSELEAPSRKADAHRGHIVEVLEHHSEQKGTPAIRIVLHSDDADFDVNYDIYVPFSFEENIRINPTDLSKGAKNPETGKNEGNEQMQYAMGIHNKKNEAVVDRLRAIAKAEGRTLAEYTDAVDTFSDYCAVLNYLGAELPVIFRRNPDRNNPRFLRVEDLLPMSALEDPKMQGLFKGRVKAWESED